MGQCSTCGGAGDFPSEQMKTWGPYAWGILHQTVETLPCPSCRAKGTAGLRAMHDLANHGLGKPLYDQENFLVVADRYATVARELRESPVTEEQPHGTPPANIAAVSRILHEGHEHSPTASAPEPKTSEGGGSRRGETKEENPSALPAWRPGLQDGPVRRWLRR